MGQRAERDRFLKLERVFKKKTNEETRASGIAPEPTELDEAMQDILERKEGAEGLHEK